MPRKKTADTSPNGNDDPAFPKISKTDAVKAALDAGVEKPKLGVAYIKETFGIEMSPSHFSQMKTLGKKRANGGAATGITPQPAEWPSPSRPSSCWCTAWGPTRS